MKKMKYIALILSIVSTFTFESIAQTIDWVDETGLGLGSSFVDGQIINDFGATGLNVRINVTIVGTFPKIKVSDSEVVDIVNRDGASFSLTILNGTANVNLSSDENLLQGEQITVSNSDGENITITETSSNGGGRMTVDGVAMTGSVPSSRVEDSEAVITEQNSAVGTFWNASMDEISSFTWLYNVVTGTSSRQGFTLTLAGIVLPIELLSFDVKNIIKDRIEIQWQTASEVNNNYFTIQKSKNARNWQDFANIPGQGNSMSIQDYYWIDEKPFSGTSYYRLKQVDYDGAFSFSRIRPISIDKPNSTIEIYPNPSINYFYIKGSNTELSECRLFNMKGEDVTSQMTINKVNNSSRKWLRVDTENVPFGVYIVRTKTTAQNIQIGNSH